MKRFLKFRYGQGGFTLIELLIVVAILGVLAAVIIPNAAGFMTTGRLNAANTEVANVKTAAVGYMAEHDGVWPVDTTVPGFDKYFTGELKATYTWSTAEGEEGLIERASMIGDGWGMDIQFYLDTQMWERTRPSP